MRKFLRISSIILLVACMGLIFFLSSQPAEVSSQTSGGVIEAIAETFYPDFENLSEPERVEVVASFQFVARKSAHIGIFALLGFFAFLTFISYVNLRFFTRAFLAVAVSCIYAASDELHQRFVAGRSCELRDFLLDTAGVLAAILLCSAFVKMIRPWRRKTAFAGNTRSKKALVGLTNELYEKLDDSVYENKMLQKEIEDYKIRIEKLEKDLEWQAVKGREEPIAEATVTPEIDQMEKKEIKLSDEMEYASSVIGAAVVEVTRLCNKLTTDEQDSTRKELVNLSLGRTEVLKAEILKILGKEISFQEKKELIEKEKQDTYDYFNSIIAQIC